MATPATASPPLLDHFAASLCLRQDSSPFFARLPVEIRRQIYVEIWRTFGSLCPHIATTSGARADGTPASCFVAASCLLTPDVPSTEEPPDDEAGDVQPVRVFRTRGRSGNSGNGSDSDSGSCRQAEPLRQPSIDFGPPTWSGHRQCRDRALRLPDTAHVRPFLPILLTCRRAYVEAVGLLYSALTFQLADVDAANVFLSRWPCVSSVRLHMCLSSSLLDTFREGVPAEADSLDASCSDPPALDVGHQAGEVDAPAWRRLCARIAALPSLRRLYVWVESSDQRAWHHVVDEVRLFAGLFGLSPQTVDSTPSTAPLLRASLARPLVVLALPTLPPEKSNTIGNPLAMRRRLPAGCYLVTGPDGEPPRLPCTVRRAWRPSAHSRLLVDLQLVVHPERRSLSIASTGLVVRQRPPQWP